MRELPLTFDAWLAEEFRETGGFTALVVLMAIGDLSVTPLRSTFFHVIGDETRWAEIAQLLAGSGVAWDGVLFATVTGKDGTGPVIDLVARSELAQLTDGLQADRMVINDHHFFDRWGRPMRIDEATPQ